MAGIGDEKFEIRELRSHEAARYFGLGAQEGTTKREQKLSDQSDSLETGKRQEPPMVPLSRPIGYGCYLQTCPHSNFLRRRTRPNFPLPRRPRQNGVGSHDRSRGNTNTVVIRDFCTRTQDHVILDYCTNKPLTSGLPRVRTADCHLLEDLNTITYSGTAADYGPHGRVG